MVETQLTGGAGGADIENDLLLVEHKHGEIHRGLPILCSGNNFAFVLHQIYTVHGLNRLLYS